MNPESQKYDPIKFWIQEKTDLPKPNQKAESILAHIEHIKALTYLLQHIKDNVESVLEIGCGYGRITKYLFDNSNNTLPNLRSYDAIDLSPLKIETARSYIPAEKHRKLMLWTENFAATRMQIARRYDLVFSSQVLMHQPPSDIGSWIKKMSSLSRRYIINLDWFEEQEPANVAPWNFIHDYEKIYMRQVKPQPETIQSIRMAVLKQNVYLVTKGHD